ncbi:hypothetical protein [Clostridium saccharoperbutylacetonicum]|uniref:hypothetical protein n=1 Tax=Clostridium saccharoperbutylacetonicum TaxID=36745 RepID=UPI0039EC271F
MRFLKMNRRNWTKLCKGQIQAKQLEISIKERERMILAIDPGNIESGYVVLDDLLRPIESGKILNEDLLNKCGNGSFSDCKHIAVEMVASYGMAVGATVFETCVWIGRFTERLQYELDIEPRFIYRKDEKMNLCGNMKAKDSNIVQALIDRFAPNTPNKGKGRKKEPGWFYGFKKDIWQAYAVGITYFDMYIAPNIKKEG